MKAVANGKAIKLRTDSRCSHKRWSAQSEVTKEIARGPRYKPGRHEQALLVRFSLGLTVKPIAISVEAELKVADTKDIMAAKSPASTRPKTPVGSCAKRR